MRVVTVTISEGPRTARPATGNANLCDGSWLPPRFRHIAHLMWMLRKQPASAVMRCGRLLRQPFAMELYKSTSVNGARRSWGSRGIGAPRSPQAAR